MDKSEMLYNLESVVEESKVGVLATTDLEGRPAMRWMTLAIINGRSGSLFAVTSPNFRKVAQIEAHPEVEWMIQTRDLNRIINLKGSVTAVDNPSLKSEVLEAIGKRLEIFWRVNLKTEFLILETIIDEATYFHPMLKSRQTVSFR
ncbi:MAG TPA: pyridoxamine 5'-phosphate oxidase family protein [Spirochaetia bacterium]|nr:pyridoxamine 5'-phosphate oxidase family protein [Spirochaetia bacterium]